MNGELPVTRLQTAYRRFGHVKIAGALLSGIAIFAMMLFIAVDVVSRNFLGGSIPGGFEISQNYFMPLAVFPALGWVFASGALPRMDLVLPRLPTRLRTAAVHTLVVLELVLAAIVTYYAWWYAMAGLQRGSTFPAGGELYPLYPFYFLVPLGFALIAVEILFVLTRNLLSDTVALSMEPPAEIAADPAP